MSWRVLIGFLVIVGIGCWQGGIRLGEWLVNKAPATISAGNDAKNQAALDDKSKLTLAQPPQPRIDGTLGVPKEIPPVEWSVLAISVDGIVRDPDEMIRIDIPKAEADMPSRELSTGGSQLSQGPSDIVTIDAPRASGQPPMVVASIPQTPATPAIPAIPARPAEPLKPAKPNSPMLSWQQALKNDLDQCNKLRFLDRPRCVEQAQRKFCEPNRGWGQTANCPDIAGTSNRTAGG